ncbi:hypothetical protein XSR1_50016 [Xenorhabdus szentirmaii DSM 16338]|uniref:Uncharacterized protein n=1 Tax=Xenorhabdus szentirmaii DSM 16338 TaxID=1427518 RepID=W1J3G6_9GAMM|nr:hypothetical protein XSR1_50016 [Xenorhabdus szentirmaii DSM 16338]
MAIPIVLVKEDSEILVEDRPYQYTTVWNEIIKGNLMVRIWLFHSEQDTMGSHI